MKVLVTGATGYVGGRLVPRLIAAGHQVRAGVREPARLAARAWSDVVETVALDVSRPETIGPALADVDAAYYLIHSMQDTVDFEGRDRRAADAFGAAAQDHGVGHVIYLGGLQPRGVDQAEVSKHLRSRAEVGAVLGRHVPTTEFRAGPIIGSGSASFEMTRYLTEHLPAMVAPRWIDTQVSPIAIRDVLRYLVAALDAGPCGIVDIGCDPLRFRDMMQTYARERGLRARLIVRVPVLTPRLAGLWVQLVTPIPNRIAVPIIQGIVHPLVADTARAAQHFPDIEPMPYPEAVRLALAKIQQRVIETRWSDAQWHGPDHRLTRLEGLIHDTQVVEAPHDAAHVYATLCGLGGDAGWPLHPLWRLRGAADRAFGGPGLRRGRRHPRELRPGDALDFWRVEEADVDRRLLLRAEMRVPGRAWLQWELQPQVGGTRVIQTASFHPRGLPGVLYWKLLYPVHHIIFRRLARDVAKA